MIGTYIDDDIGLPLWKFLMEFPNTHSLQERILPPPEMRTKNWSSLLTIIIMVLTNVSSWWVQLLTMWENVGVGTTTNPLGWLRCKTDLSRFWHCFYLSTPLSCKGLTINPRDSFSRSSSKINCSRHKIFYTSSSQERTYNNSLSRGQILYLMASQSGKSLFVNAWLPYVIKTTTTRSLVAFDLSHAMPNAPPRAFALINRF